MPDWPDSGLTSRPFAGSGAEMSADSLAAAPYDQDSLEEEEEDEDELMDGRDDTLRTSWEGVEEEEEEEGELADTRLQVSVCAAGRS